MSKSGGSKAPSPAPGSKAPSPAPGSKAPTPTPGSKAPTPTPSRGPTPPPARVPPKLVYRADTRNPPDVFTNGFTARGGVDGDNDLLAHVIGGPNLLKTGFISTTQTLRVAAAFIKPSPKPDGTEDAIIDKRDPTIKYIRRVGWIYTINTTGLDMQYVPDYLASQGDDRKVRQFGYQQEWAAKGEIKGKNIWKALRVDGYFYRYSDPANMPRGVDILFPPDKNPFTVQSTESVNSSYAFK